MTSFARFKAPAAAVLAATLLVLSGCSVLTEPKPDQTSATSAAPKPTAAEDQTPAPVPAGFEDLYGQEVDWAACGGGAFECAEITAPLDWNDPDAGTTTLSIKKYNAREQAQGTILLNPGGPGGSGVELVGYAPMIFGKELLKNFNLLGFDPRGVGESDPVACFEPAEMDQFLATSFGEVTPEVAERIVAANTKFAEACAENSGDILGFVDTQSAAKDMDLLRALMGDNKLNYLGFSYGTQLGATYAGLFPKNVGAMVLDGAIDLRLTGFEQSLQQAVGFENALRAFVEDCQSGSDCPLAGTVDQGMAQVGELLDSLLVSPLPTNDPGRVLTNSLAFYGVAQPLYAEQLWAQLRTALTGAIVSQDGSGLLALSDSYFGRDADGTYANNSFEAFNAINCLDSREDSDFATMQEEAAKIKEAAPIMGGSFGFGGLGCANWPYPVAEQTFDLAATGAAPIMVIGTTNDPATPYVWAQGLAEQLDSGFLVTHVGEGHTAYGMGSQCIVNTVDDFFINGTIPDTDPRCQ